MPRIATTVADTRAAIAQARKADRTIGFVPTMGALHEGHASLLRAARMECGFVVASIFVNPTQFGPHEDLSRYPRPFQADVALCAIEGVDLIFHPSPEILYPPGFRTWVEVEGLQDVLCGPARPGHFRGVATVVAKLFNIVGPDTAYFGQKDFQQARLLQQMVRDLDFPLTLKVLPTVREDDGLALSSRNRYLTEEQRRRATVLHRALKEVRRLVKAGERDSTVLVETLRSIVAAEPEARLDYAAVVDADTLQPVEVVRGPCLAALAVFLGTTRLIDNVRLDPEAAPISAGRSAG